MSNASGIFAFVNPQKSVLFDSDFLTIGRSINKALKQNFTDSDRFEIGIDQSTTCTGICITDTQNTCYCLVDFKRESTDKDLYKVQLKKLVSEIVKGLRINLIVFEKPLNKRFSKATPVLRELFGFIKSWKLEIDELYDAKSDSIFPHQWKAKVLDKSKGTGRTAIKSEIAIDICDKIPVLNRYRIVCPAKDFDSFDATGILMGYKLQKYTSDGKAINFGSAVYNYKMSVFLKYLPKELIYNKQAIIDYLPINKDIKNFPILEYSDEHSFYDNIKMCCANYDCSALVIKSTQQTINLLWETGEDLRPGNLFVCVVLKQGFTTNKRIASASEKVPYFHL